MSATNYHDWYKKYYGKDYDEENNPGFVRTTDMTDEQYETGSALYKYYINGKGLKDTYNAGVGQVNDTYKTVTDNAKAVYDNAQNKLLKNYSVSRDALTSDKNAAVAGADRRYALMQKYLPEKLRQMGVGSSGMSESSFIEAYNNHVNNIGSIERNYGTNLSALEQQHLGLMSDAETDYTTSMNDAEKDKASALSLLEQNYLKAVGENDLAAADSVKEIMKRYADIEKEEKKAALELIGDTLDNYLAEGDYENAKKYLGENKETLGDTLYNAYLSDINIASEKDNKTIEAGSEEEERILTGVDTLKAEDGSEYRLTEKLEKNSKHITKNEDFAQKLKAAGYADPFSPNIKNGFTIEFEEKEISDFWWYYVTARSGKVIPKPAPTKYTATYMNGNWYLSEKVEDDTSGQKTESVNN